MRLYELTMALCARLEVLNPDLVRRARASWDPGHGMLDGAIAGQMLDHIKNILPYIDDNLKRDAYNEIADAEELGRIDEDEVNFDLWISDALLDPVINMLIDVESSDNLAQKGLMH
ncbi:hypothetical protein [Propionivibrio sp.]|uniref:hypothetical protein n=1 Tax=Propionivibrio sp. TaxID=2212460 RepID=UPI003BF0ADFF